MPKQAPRVLPHWAHPKRAQEEAQLRKDNLWQFPPPFEKVCCPVCGKRAFRVWYDRFECLLCRLYLKLEGPDKKDLKALKVYDATFGDDGELECPVCLRHSYYIFADRLSCYYCKKVLQLGGFMVYFWPLEPVHARRDVMSRGILGRSTLNRELKRQQAREAR